MIVGAANKGKTSLLMNLTKKGKMTRFKEVEVGYNNRPLATVGVDLGDWEYAPNKKPKVTFMTWDFGGQVGLCLIPIPLCVVHECSKEAVWSFAKHCLGLFHFNHFSAVLLLSCDIQLQLREPPMPTNQIVE